MEEFARVFAAIEENCAVDRMVSRLERCMFNEVRRYTACSIMEPFVNIIQHDDYRTVYQILRNMRNNHIDMEMEMQNLHEIIRRVVEHSRIDRRIHQILILVCEQCESLVPHP